MAATKIYSAKERWGRWVEDDGGGLRDDNILKMFLKKSFLEKIKTNVKNQLGLMINSGEYCSEGIIAILTSLNPKGVT